VAPVSPQTVSIPFRWGRLEGKVTIELGVNDDPAAFGCAEFARGFPYLRATVTPPAVGYADALGWVQLMDSSLHGDGFLNDPFAPLGEVPHPFNFFGFSPTFFDAPHTDEPNWDLLVHTFLCGLGGELMELRHEVRALLGISWGFSMRDRRIESFGPTRLGAEDWDRHHDYLEDAFEVWKFAPGFFDHPLQP
jgi:hypothetical protein